MHRSASPRAATTRLCARISVIIAIAISAITTTSATAAPLLWNKLGSAAEVTNSAYGPNLSYYTNPGDFVAVAGNPQYVPGVFGNAVTIGPGPYYTPARVHTLLWNNLDQYLNPDRGTIETWFKQDADPVGFSYGVYRLFDGSYGLDSGIGLTSEVTPNPTLNFGIGFGGTGIALGANISPLNGTWLHVAGVWDRDGIDGTLDKARLYINGNIANSTTLADWGSTVGQRADIAGGNDEQIAGKFAMDNLKVYDTAVTDFSGRFTEELPEPSGAAAALIGLIAIARRRR
jgi:hypothetical protein